MTQILGTGEGKTSSAAKEPVVERKPAQVFFESMALAARRRTVQRPDGASARLARISS